ncbi:hypothetical protein [Brevibacillus brevis]|uniref:Uncharacterized protein n=1 Tax=Brevibacillus brevis TaxID=1393 RepID=A0ABY9T472_BREBE|nr:hypothetical protein [Brevibacillus brevis]WNC14885.1 hypothetical protein RGB73_00345 [Brevibacillus brevis]
MQGYMQSIESIIAAINDLPGKLMTVVFSSITQPIQTLTHTLVVTNILLGLLVVASIANFCMLWRNGRK